MRLWPFGRKPSKEVAKKRLQLVLRYDRAGLPPNAIEDIKIAILKALDAFPFVDTQNIKLNITGDNSEKIDIEIPVKN
ncbi:MAG: cell division topological specificity factor MinE [Nitrospiraceae bacterium]|nr:cell division topological specificity factor MinE [Nitrospiraceae bacterium]